MAGVFAFLLYLFGDFCGNVVFVALHILGLGFLFFGSAGVGFYFLFMVWFGVFVGFIMVLAFPCFLIGLLASPLCGAALTFFAAAKKVSKESGLKTASF
ncbi:hypothetical protein [Paraburkholderia phenazinium]|jgi:hypothetical protein|uniref:Uncharacterized protein n=1 Tax=Paraburkholderia phenazinium TaxID=60549 RepID=A0A1G8NRY5_9BURK|nr:hypothetical protein [Paraburkholderia phenazinium]SDH93685.1 hypothetical protein SAMN05216466_1151 [Paraburkholderia phenazinium]SDI82964.1 hypothetical protein SAMN05216466_1371 [Paraburkholderia phenazinium]